jgi:hypothetical protein
MVLEEYIAESEMVQFKYRVLDTKQAGVALETDEKGDQRKIPLHLFTKMCSGIFL